jgi:hypothetical protein
MFAFLLQPSPRRKPQTEELEMTDLSLNTQPPPVSSLYHFGDSALFLDLTLTYPKTPIPKKLSPPPQITLVHMPPLLDTLDETTTRVNGVLIATRLCALLSLKAGTRYIWDEISGIIVRQGGGWNGTVVYSRELPSYGIQDSEAGDRVNGTAGIKNAVLGFLIKELNVRGKGLEDGGIWIDGEGNVGSEGSCVVVCNWKVRLETLQNMGVMRRWL